jgi:hypothetical protein
VNDTPNHIHKKQVDILLAKSMTERFEMGLQMMEDVRQMVINSIRSDDPGISEKALKIEFIKRYYRNDLNEDYLNDVIRWINPK